MSFSVIVTKPFSVSHLCNCEGTFRGIRRSQAEAKCGFVFSLAGKYICHTDGEMFLHQDSLIIKHYAETAASQIKAYLCLFLHLSLRQRREDA